MSPKKITIKLGEQSYPIIIGENASSLLLRYIPSDVTKIIVISDKKLIDKRKNLLKLLKKTSHSVEEIAVVAGEEIKSTKSVDEIFGKLIKLKADRNSLIVALGGGTIGDVAGYVAATYMRGIRWVGLPTTLLSQVDSSIGGKTGINHVLGKNLIGAFHQPILVLCDISYLKSLSSRELVSGLGEVTKYAIAFDKKFFLWLDKNISKILKGDKKSTQLAIEKSIKWKCDIVSKDVFDRKGKRETLNFGHTFGHALESATKYKKFQHGEAVIWGMRFAINLSEMRGHLSSKEKLKIESLLLKLKVPPLPTQLGRDTILGHMKHDKKSQGKSIRFVLLTKRGKTLSDSKVTRSDLIKTYTKLDH